MPNKKMNHQIEKVESQWDDGDIYDNNKPTKFNANDLVLNDIRSITIPFNFNAMKKEVSLTLTKGIFALNGILESDKATDYAKIEAIKTSINFYKFVDEKIKQEREENIDDQGVVGDDLEEINIGIET